MDKFAPANIERHLVQQTRNLLSRIDAASSRLRNVDDVKALMMLVDHVADNVSALTGDAVRDNRRDCLSIAEADYLFSRPFELRHETRDAIHEQMQKFTAAMRATLDPPKDEDVPF